VKISWYLARNSPYADNCTSNRKLQWTKKLTGGRTNTFNYARFWSQLIRAAAVTTSDISPTYVKTENFRSSDTNAKGRQYLCMVWRLAQTLAKLPGGSEVCAETYCNWIRV